MLGKLKIFLFKLLLTFIAIGLIVLLIAMFINNKVKADTANDIVYRVNDEVNIHHTALQEMKNLKYDCILVLGAGIQDRETPTPMLRDRLDVGIELYEKGVAPKILLSGDNGQVEHNELHVMLNYVLEAGVPQEDIFCDHAGFSTYDSLYRASSIFGVTKAIVVTQEYHQYRALYIGRVLGIEVKGVAANQEEYMGQFYRDVREFLARVKDFFKAALRPEPLLGGEAIPISGSGIISHGE